ncbi:MAG: DUF1631 domain-containing protein [Gammaproteobacteria bacterium]|nr:DUF1631 domain-containing protein [Gammaproteobacteria bacterium]MCW8910770.1 DUF1631 domain-containing protein [Gammaproteobacteria bacterium]MCW9003665.1 DUF1631 domain-containing protein [Gammaproteobacteria bacterium]MCW9055768.1 DUF1631 domain-containing protein [Gammaproteobacteria bacterium]
MSVETNIPEAAKDPDRVKEVIKNFINGDSDSSIKTSTAQATDGKQFHDRREIIKALTQLQITYKPEYTPGQSVNINTDDFKFALLQSMAKISNSAVTKSVNQVDDRTIDFVEMIFGAFLRDKNISDSIKSLLLKLQIPMIKIAMLDKQFFQNNRHPARHVLDTMAHIGIGIDNPDNPVYQTMNLIIDQLLNTFDQNIASFNTAYASLSRLTKIEAEKHEQKEAETHQQILKEHARQIVITELQYHTKNRNLPADVKPLILKQWSTLMFNHFLRNGKDSDEWNEIVSLLKQMINGLQPITTKEQWTFHNNESEEFTETIKNKLYTTKQDKGSIDTSIDALKKAYQKILEETDFDDDAINSLESEETLENTSKELAEENIADQIAQLPAEVKQGVWFEIFKGEGQSVRRLKLSMILFDEAKLVFVDRVGVKVLEKDAAEFNEELKTNKSRILADHSVFDHALGQVIASLII